MIRSSKTVLILAFCFILQNTRAQIVFIPQPTHQTFQSGIVTACADINGDYIDDILVLDKSKFLHVGYNNGNGEFLWKKFDKTSSNLGIALCVADIDNNGFNDIFVGNVLEPSSLIYQYASGFVKKPLPFAPFVCQGANFFDVNQDGWIDLTTCDDENVNKLFLNDQIGHLYLDSQLIDFKVSTDKNFNGGNYSCLWSDYDFDGDADLHISKCWAQANDPTDIRRINTFYKKENQIWKNRADELGINIGDQSWTAALEDLNGDQLLDLIVINHYTPSSIFLQKQNHEFQDWPASSSGFNYDGFGFQIQCADFDNDMDNDILVTGSHAELFLNDGLGVFTKVKDFPLSISSAAIADINGDGFLDLYGSTTQDIFYYSFSSDRLLTQKPNQNHFAVFCLKGVNSNVCGIGAKLIVHAGGKIQVKEMRSGQSYGIQNTLNVHVGLGINNMIDSIQVWWPSGIKSVYYNIGSNQKYLITENSCIIPFRNIFDEKSAVSCMHTIDTVLLSDPKDRNVIWNDGISGVSRQVIEEGIYFYKATDSMGCPILSNSILIRSGWNKIVETNITGDQWLCLGEYLELKTAEGISMNWSSGDVGSEIQIDKEGLYSATKYPGLCDTLKTEPIQVYKSNALTRPIVLTDTINPGENANCRGDVDDLFWYESDTSIIPVFVGRNYITPKLDSSTCYFVSAFSKHRYSTLAGGEMSFHARDSIYHDNDENNQLQFEVDEDIFIDSFSVYTDYEGIRAFQIGSYRKEYFCKNGWTRVPFQYYCRRDESPFVLTTNSGKNILNWGSISPKLARSNLHVTYPYKIGKHLMIRNSNRGDSLYYYFYNWAVRPVDKTCESEREKVCIPVRTVGLDDIGQAKIDIFQRDQFLVVSSPTFMLNEVLIYSIEGIEIWRECRSKNYYEFDLSNCKPGVYSVMIKSGKQVLIKKIIFI